MPQDYINGVQVNSVWACFLLHCGTHHFSAAANSHNHISPEHFNLNPRWRKTQRFQQPFDFNKEIHRDLKTVGSFHFSLLVQFGRRLCSLHTDHALHCGCSGPPSALERGPALPTSAEGLRGPADSSSAPLSLFTFGFLTKSLADDQAFCCWKSWKSPKNNEKQKQKKKKSY